MDAFLVVMGLFVLMVALCVAVAAACALAAVICLTVWALVKPLMSGLIDAWLDWFDRRTGC